MIKRWLLHTTASRFCLMYCFMVILVSICTNDTIIVRPTYLLLINIGSVNMPLSFHQVHSPSCSLLPHLHPHTVMSLFQTLESWTFHVELNWLWDVWWMGGQQRWVLAALRSSLAKTSLQFQDSFILLVQKINHLSGIMQATLLDLCPFTVLKDFDCTDQC